MATCNAGGDCRIHCPGGCGCIYVHETDECICKCYNGEPTDNVKEYSLGNLISISVAGLQLGQVGAHLDGLLAREVLVPASRVHEKVNLRVKRASFSKVIRTLGLSTRIPVKAGRASKR